MRYRESSTFPFKNQTARRTYSIQTRKSLKPTVIILLWLTSLSKNANEKVFRSSFRRALRQTSEKYYTLPTRRRHTMIILCRLYIVLYRNFIASQLYVCYCSHGRTECQRASTAWVSDWEEKGINPGKLSHIIIRDLARSFDDGVSTKRPTIHSYIGITREIVRIIIV